MAAAFACFKTFLIRRSSGRPFYAPQVTKVPMHRGRPPRWRCWRSVSADRGRNAALMPGEMGMSRCPRSGLRPFPQPCLRGPGRAAPPDGCGGVPGVRGVPELREAGRCGMRSSSVQEMGFPVLGEEGVMGWGSPGMGWKGFRGPPMLKNWRAGGWKCKNGGPEGPRV